jgi:VWFA-related protein
MLWPLFAVLAASAATPSIPPAAAQEPRLPEFRADVRVIRLDVSVVDKAGRPVPNLSPEDFTVWEDGQRMELTYFEAVSAQAGVATGLDSAVSLAPAPPRRVLLLVDTGRMSIGDLIRARKSTASYLRRTVGDGDWVRLVNLSTGRVWDGRIPDDRERLESAALALDYRRNFWADLGGDDIGGGDLNFPIQQRIEMEPMAGFGSESETSGQFLSQFAQGTGLLGLLESVLIQLEGVEGRKALGIPLPPRPGQPAQARGHSRA